MHSKAFRGRNLQALLGKIEAIIVLNCSFGAIRLYSILFIQSKRLTGDKAMMKVNDFQKYEVTLKIPYEDYFSLIYETKYLLEARLGPDRCFIANVAMYGNNRRKGVEKAVEWFNKEFKGVLGSAFKVMTVDDPFEEVSYDDDFACNDLGNKYLNQDTIDRVISESDGDLVQEDPKSENSQHNSLRRIKRRKKENTQLTSRLSQTPSGTIYYRMSEPLSSNGKRMKTTSVKLSSKSLEKALREVARRGLDKFEKLDEAKSVKKVKSLITKKAA